ncbi:helix-turn-helix transcriptional regulator [Ohtaekwangia sp.]|uniref:helix-turn-helix transcriptional regulator n=1 Tax=Ohtaekwangia sp. TaxID=2066019 RepID=UPI002FDD42BD
MTYQEFTPAENLRAFVKCYYVCEYDTNTIVHDKAFATGCMEVMFNLGGGSFQTGRENRFDTTPGIELWGQIITPLEFKSLGKNKMLGIRFYPHTASIMLNDRIDIFNDHVSDFRAAAGADVLHLHEQLLNAPSLQQQLALLDSFLLKKLIAFQKRRTKFQVVHNVITDMRDVDFCDNIQRVASRYGISSRYLQKLFVEYTGLSPKLYYKINRFQRSLILTGNHEESLTSIAYQAGYFDQSHFVRDFKLFTGFSPSAFNTKDSSAILASPNR